MRDTERDLDRLDEALQLAPALWADLFWDVTERCTRLSSLRQSGKATALDRMIGAGAYTDAAITMIALEQPNWNVRRIVYEDDEWLCSLSKHPRLPVFLDDPVEGSHPVLALAILRAFIVTRRRDPMVPQSIVSVPQVSPRADFAFCCDNFA
jgi:hypothetical protein